MESIILIRHGEPSHAALGLTGGWTDEGITEAGRRQSELVGKRLQKVLQGRRWQMYCSDLKRAVETAEIISKETTVSAKTLTQLREFDNGVAAGMTEEKAKKYFTEPTEPLLDWKPYPEAETWRRFYTRVSDCLERLDEKEKDTVVLVVHGGTIINTVLWWLRLDIDVLPKVSFDAAPTSISVLRKNIWNERTIERLNDSSHLYGTSLAEGIYLDR